MRLILNHSDVISLQRVVNEPRRSIGEMTLKKWLEVAKSLQVSPIEASLQFSNNLKIPKSKIDAILNFVNLSEG